MNAKVAIHLDAETMEDGRSAQVPIFKSSICALIDGGYVVTVEARDGVIHAFSNSTYFALWFDMGARACCHDCGVLPGEHHRDGCEIEECPGCGGVRYSCECGYAGDKRPIWTGRIPGDAECEEFGWYVKPVGNDWVPCNPNDDGAMSDINRLYSEEAYWDADAGRFRRRHQ